MTTAAHVDVLSIRFGRGGCCDVLPGLEGPDVVQEEVPNNRRLNRQRRGGKLIDPQPHEDQKTPCLGKTMKE